MSGLPLLRRYNYRAVLVRFLVNVLALLFTVWLVPHVAFQGEQRVATVLVVAAVFGLLNTFVKPFVQFLVLPFLFVSYGIAVVLINTAMLLLLSLLFDRFVVDRLIWAVVAGLVVGILGNILENVAGLNAPIMDEPPPSLSEQARRQELGPVGTLVEGMVPQPASAEPEPAEVVATAEVGGEARETL